jgi:sugar O-acyltransferase (sialic acid O-acetyltransferase NeuD family)
MSRNIVILGAGGFAREMYWHIKESIPQAKMVFANDVKETDKIPINGHIIPVIKNWEFDCVPINGPDKRCEKFQEFVIGVGSPKIKRILVQKALASGLAPAPTVIHPRALVQGDDCEIGAGGIISPGCIITTNVKIGDYVLLNLNCTVGHDGILGNYVTCNPGCCISGNVTLGEGVMLGTGSVIREGIDIASDVQTGAQTCVVKNIIDSNVTVVGIPARTLK